MGLWDGQECGTAGADSGAIAHCAAVGTFSTAAVPQGPAAIVVSSALFIPGSNNEDFTHANGRLTYSGIDTRTFLVTGQLTGTFATDAGTTAILVIMRNGGAYDFNTVGIEALDNTAGGAHRQVTTRATVRLSPGDYVELGLGRGSAAGGDQAVSVIGASLTVS